MADDLIHGGELERSWRAEIRRLERREAELATSVAHADLHYAGLKRIDDVLALVNTRFELTLRILEALRSTGTPAERLHEHARRSAQLAVDMLDELVAAGISEDQRKQVTEDPAYRRARDLFEQLLVRGGGALFETATVPARTSRVLARIVARSIRKHVAADDRYPLLFHTERLPRPLRRLVNILFSALASEHQADPPYGIEASADQQTLTAERIKLPLSQAILYLEQEILSELQDALAERPGDAGLQREIARVREQLEQLERLRFIPRSTPIVIEHGFYTDWLSGYTAEGEALVSVPLRVTYRSGTNHDRRLQAIQDEITRQCAGQGISDALDASYRHLRSLQSGIRGSSRTPSLRLNVKRGYQSLKQAVPFLGTLEDPQQLERLLVLVGGGRRRQVEAQIEQLIASGGRLTDTAGGA